MALHNGFEHSVQRILSSRVQEITGREMYAALNGGLEGIAERMFDKAKPPKHHLTLDLESGYESVAKRILKCVAPDGTPMYRMFQKDKAVNLVYT